MASTRREAALALSPEDVATGITRLEALIAKASRKAKQLNGYFASGLYVTMLLLPVGLGFGFAGLVTEGTGGFLTAISMACIVLWATGTAGLWWSWTAIQTNSSMGRFGKIPDLELPLPLQDLIGLYATRELIRMLAADDRDGRTRRASIYEWLDCERPILEMFHGFYHRLRVEGPATRVSPEVIFPIGSTLYSTGVCARLDPIQTKRLEERLRSAMDAELSRWIDEHHLRQDEPCIEIALDRPAADLAAEEQIDAWLAGRSPDQPVDWTKSDD